MSVPTTGPARFDVGRVIQNTAQVLIRNFAPFLAVSAITVGAPSLLLAAGGAAMVAQTQSLPANPFAALGMMIPGGLLLVVGFFVLEAAVIHGAIADLNRGKATLGDMLRTGLRRFLPLLAFSILFSIALVFGFLLLIVPGVLLALAWSVATPALVVENTGVFGAFSRSADLTRGYRGYIFVLWLILFVVSMVFSVVTQLISAPFVLMWGPLNPGSLILSAVINILSGMVNAAGIAALYYELRLVKEGIGPETLASVFD